MSAPAMSNIRTQIGKETTPGTAVAATQQMAGLYFTDEPHIDSQQFTPQGRGYPSESVRGKDWSELSIVADFPDFNGLTYVLASLLGAVTPSTHPTGTNSKDWQFLTKLTDLVIGQTYTVERGSSVWARKFPYVLVDALTLSGTKDSVQISGHAFARTMQRGITLTASVPVLPAIPLAGINVNTYLNTSSATIGTTQLIVDSWSIAFSNFFAPKYQVDRSQTSFSKMVPLRPKIEIKLKVDADTTGMALFAYIESGQTVYERIDITGPIIETTIPYNLQIDCAVKMAQPSAFGDDQAVESIEFTGVVCEDTTWGGSGTALKALVTNVLSAL